jgi:hypothetical protein
LAPPTRRLFTSTIGFTLLIAALKTSKASLPDFFAMVSSAP